MFWTYFLIVIALLLIFGFTFTNGMHDVSNILSTMISSGALSPGKALLLAGTFELFGPLIGGTMVAKTVASFVNINAIRSLGGNGVLLIIVSSAIIGAAAWNLITYFRGLPSSSSHALFGALAGAAVMSAGNFSVIDWGFRDFDILALRGFAGIAVALFLSPLLGFFLGFVVNKIVRFSLRWASPKANKVLKRLQIVTCSSLAYSHATNATQKSMALVAIILLAAGYSSEFRITFSVRIFCALAMSAGALSGGWRIMKTVGRGIFKVRPEHSFETQLASTLIILTNSHVGGPVSSTHIVTTTVMGVGMASRMKAVRWGKVSEILMAWLSTLPAGFILGALSYIILSPLQNKIG